jgi:hypothetical protein
MVRSTFSQAAAPPRTSSTTFRSGYVLIVRGLEILHEYGQVKQKNWLIGYASPLRTCKSVPSKGQNHIFRVLCALFNNSTSSNEIDLGAYLWLVVVLPEARVASWWISGAVSLTNAARVSRPWIPCNQIDRKDTERVFDTYVFFLTNAVTASPSWSDQASVTMRARMNEDENIFVKWFSQ